MKDILHVLHATRHVGALEYDRKTDKIALSYEGAWQFGKDSFPVSLSLPLAKRIHPDDGIRPFLEGLLPDNEAVLEAWGKRFQVSPRNPFDVIKHVGEDCAGALQFVRPERLDLILSGGLDSLTALSDADLVKRMENLQIEGRAIPTSFEGRFSLAGAQLKDALYRDDDGCWFLPAGSVPSTHILKPQPEKFEDLALNEHFCLQLASEIGLTTARSEILEIGGKMVLCVRRYDRLNGAGSGDIIRLHQEDMCQALGKYPRQKYQNEGGPSAAEIVKLLNRYSDDSFDDAGRFVMALALNWVIAGTDAHSKNYSLIHSEGSVLRMAPLYDLASNLPYERDPNSTKVKLAMKIGGTYRLLQIDASRWEAWALEADVSVGWAKAFVNTVVHQILAKIEKVRESIAVTHDSPFLHKLADAIAERANKCSEMMI